MAKIRTGLLILSICLLLTVMAGCQGQTASQPARPGLRTER